MSGNLTLCPADFYSDESTRVQWTPLSEGRILPLQDIYRLESFSTSFKQDLHPLAVWS